MVAKISKRLTTWVGGRDNDDVDGVYGTAPGNLKSFTLGDIRSVDRDSSWRALDGEGSKEGDGKECVEHLILQRKTDKRGVIKGGGGSTRSTRRR